MGVDSLLVPAARRAYAAGSRDGAREMRLKAARLVADRDCVCDRLDPDHPDCGARWKYTTLVAHDPACPAALAEAIRRLPDGGDGGEGEAPANGEGPLAGWGGGS